MKNFVKIIVLFFILFIPIENKLFASDVYFIDYSKVMNESVAGKKAQNFLKNLLNNSNKKFNEMYYHIIQTTLYVKICYSTPKKEII